LLCDATSLCENDFNMVGANVADKDSEFLESKVIHRNEKESWC
jgi:hypothetical protein